ncbi:MAG: hypothetical protein LM591_03685 [Candidatus Korarchaeum sp.]|nr:hypothetical protein [Candidatus Korarchaeum sp.]
MLDNPGDGIKIRASIGTLARIGITRVKLEVYPRTAYLLLSGGCSASCLFCPQWIEESRVSRVSWPEVELEYILSAQKLFERVCIQSVLRRMFWRDLVKISSLFEIPVSISTNPVGERELFELRRNSQMIGIGIDATSSSLFEAVRKPGSFESYLKFFERSLRVYGKGNVYVHLIAGLGEDLKDIVRIMSYIYDRGGAVALFAFTPVPGTPLQDREPPPITYYRFVQIVNYFLREGIPLGRVRSLDPDDYKEAFLTSGCPGCNRPFYNERPSGKLYNFPSKELLESKWEGVREEVRASLDYLRFLP